MSPRVWVRPAKVLVDGKLDISECTYKEGATNPMADGAQKILATALAAGATSEGNNQNRAGSQEPVELPRLFAMSAPARRTLMVWADLLLCSF
jgi:hypothetical protein